MDHHINPAKAGLAFGGLLGGLHVLWSVLVALGWAQTLVTFSLWAHMVSLPLVVGAFDITAAVTVIVIAALVGCVVGYVFATIWNRVHRG